MDAMQIQEKIDIEYVKYLRKLNDGELELSTAQYWLASANENLNLRQIAGLAKAIAVYLCQ